MPCVGQHGPVALIGFGRLSDREPHVLVGFFFLLERALVIAWACPGRSSVLPRATGHARLVVLMLEGVVKHKGQSGLIRFPRVYEDGPPYDTLSGIS